MTRAYRSCWWATSAIWMTSARCPWASANWGRSSGRCPMWRPRLKPAKMWTRWVVVWILPKGSWYFYHPRGGRMSNPSIINEKINLRSKLKLFRNWQAKRFLSNKLKLHPVFVRSTSFLTEAIYCDLLFLCFTYKRKHHWVPPIFNIPSSKTLIL